MENVRPAVLVTNAAGTAEQDNRRTRHDERSGCTLYIGKVIKDTALCGLGQTSPNPVLSTLNNMMNKVGM